MDKNQNTAFRRYNGVRLLEHYFEEAFFIQFSMAYITLLAACFSMNGLCKVWPLHGCIYRPLHPPQVRTLQGFQLYVQWSFFIFADENDVSYLVLCKLLFNQQFKIRRFAVTFSVGCLWSALTELSTENLCREENTKGSSQGFWTSLLNNKVVSAIILVSPHRVIWL